MLCHGSGDLARDGCCWVDGRVCPLRLKISNGKVYDAIGTDLGTPQEVAATYTKNKSVQNKAVNQLQGVNIVCRAAVESIVADPSRINNRPALNAAWDTHPEYVEKVRPVWERIENELGLAPGEYNCSTWSGIGKPQCCFAESLTVNEEKARGLSAEARQVRQAGGK